MLHILISSLIKVLAAELGAQNECLQASRLAVEAMQLWLRLTAAEMKREMQYMFECFMGGKYY